MSASGFTLQAGGHIKQRIGADLLHHGRTLAIWWISLVVLEHRWRSDDVIDDWMRRNQKRKRALEHIFICKECLVCLILRSVPAPAGCHTRTAVALAVSYRVCLLRFLRCGEPQVSGPGIHSPIASIPLISSLPPIPLVFSVAVPLIHRANFFQSSLKHLRYRHRYESPCFDAIERCSRKDLKLRWCARKKQDCGRGA